MIITTDDLFNKGKVRSALGHPPGKKNSIGDAICWECLLGFFNSLDEVTVESKESHNLYVVSMDGDYVNALNEKVPKDYLSQEWQATTGGRFIFSTLFLNCLKRTILTCQYRSGADSYLRLLVNGPLRQFKELRTLADRKSTRLNSSHPQQSRMPSSA